MFDATVKISDTRKITAIELHNLSDEIINDLDSNRKIEFEGAFGTESQLFELEVADDGNATVEISDTSKFLDCVELHNLGDEIINDLDSNGETEFEDTFGDSTPNCLSLE